MWDFLKNVGSYAGDLVGLDGKFGAQADFGGNAGNFGLANIGTSLSGLAGSGGSNKSYYNPNASPDSNEYSLPNSVPNGTFGDDVTTSTGLLSGLAGYVNPTLEYLNKNKDAISVVGGLAGKYFENEAAKDAQSTIEQQIAYNKEKDEQAKRRLSLANSGFTGGFNG